MRIDFPQYHRSEIEAARDAYLFAIGRALAEEKHADAGSDDVDLLFAHGEMIALEGFTYPRLVREAGQVWNPES